MFQKQKKKDIEIVAMDCEMVGSHQGNMLARVSVVNSKGKTIYDKFVKPTAKVIDYRTSLSGIQHKDIENGVALSKVKKEVTEILKNKLLVGHLLEAKHFKVLKISHPKHMIRDTSTYPQFVRLTNNQTPSLKRLAFHYLKTKIQHGKHRSVQNAKAALQLYKLFRKNWESQVK